MRFYDSKNENNLAGEITIKDPLEHYDQVRRLFSIGVGACVRSLQTVKINRKLFKTRKTIFVFKNVHQAGLAEMLTMFAQSSFHRQACDHLASKCFASIFKFAPALGLSFKWLIGRQVTNLRGKPRPHQHSRPV